MWPEKGGGWKFLAEGGDLLRATFIKELLLQIWFMAQLCCNV